VILPGGIIFTDELDIKPEKAMPDMLGSTGSDENRNRNTSFLSSRRLPANMSLMALLTLSTERKWRAKKGRLTFAGPSPVNLSKSKNPTTPLCLSVSPPVQDCRRRSVEMTRFQDRVLPMVRRQK
jgi:hypothetical protein